MKVTKEKLNQIIQEELAALAEEDAEIAAALMGKAGLPRSAQNTKVDRPDPVMPQELGPEDDPEREEEELPEISQQEAIDAFIEAFIKFPKEKQMSWRGDKEKLNYVLNQFIRNYQMGAIDGTPEDLDGIWNALNEGYEHEGSMARSQLGRTAEMAAMIQGMISDDTNLEEWVESKITKAQDYLSSVLNYMRGESLSEAQEDDEPAENYALEKMQDALLELVPGYDLDKDMELMVRDELIELIKKIRAAKKEK
jgi:hypothetical protein